MTKYTIGFLAYPDFVEELGEKSIREVRLQENKKTFPNHNKITDWVDWYITISAYAGNEIYAIHLGIGGCWNWEEEKVSQLITKTEEAVALVRDDLTRRYLKVMPGIIVGAELYQGLASLNSLPVEESMAGQDV